MKTLLFFLVTLFTFLAYSQDSISVLFIGNSYTYANDLPLTLKNLALSKGDVVTVDSKTNGGYTFQNHSTDGLTYQKIKSKPWDFVVLQAQSQEPSFPYDQVTSNTLPYAKQLSDSVYASKFCTQVMYFMTWGRKVGDPQWDSINTFDKMNERLRLAYLRFTKLSEASISPVGVAWKKAIELYPSVNLYVGDGSHPSLEGTYLTACVFYASLFRKSPVGASFTAGIDATVAANFQEIARQVVLDSLENWYLRPASQITIADFEMAQNVNTIQCTNKSWRAQNYVWDFNDGNTSTLVHPTHQFNTAGNYSVSLKAISECNDSLITKPLLIDLLSTTKISEEKVKWVYINKVFSCGLAKNSFEEINVFNELGQSIAIEWIDDKTFQLKLSTKQNWIILHYKYQGKIYTDKLGLH